MNEWTDILGHALVHRLGGALLHFLWQGALVGVVAGLLLAAGRRRSAQARYVTLLVLLGVAAACPVGTFLIRGESAAPRRTLETQQEPAPASPTRRTTPPDRTPSTAPPAHVVSEFEPAVGPSLPEPTQAPPDRSPAEAQPNPVGAQPSGDSQALLPWLVVAWGCGVTLLALRMMGGWWRTRALLTHHVQPLTGGWQPVIDRLTDALNVRRVVCWWESTAATVPLTVGWLRPVVVVPTSVLTGMTPAEVECLLAHELAHIRRHDYLINLLQCTVEVLLFYHPVVWWLSRRIRQEREALCDELAVSVTGDRVTYSRALLSVADLATRPLPLAVAASGGQLKERVQRVLGLPTASARSSIGAAATCMAVILIVTVSLLATSNDAGLVNDEKAVAGEQDARDNEGSIDLQDEPAAARELEVEVIDASKPPDTPAEKAITRLVLVYFQDQLRRAVSGVMIESGNETLVVTTGPACLVPEGVPHAIDRAYLEIPGWPPIKAKYFHEKSTAELFVYRTQEFPSPYRLDERVTVSVGDSLSAVEPNGKGELRVWRDAAIVTALDGEYDLENLKGKILRYRNLLEVKRPRPEGVLGEVSRPFPEGTPFMKDGKLAGIALLGTRFLGADARKSYLVPAERIAEQLGLLERSNDADDPTQKENAEDKLVPRGSTKFFDDGKFRVLPISGRVVDSQGRPVAGAAVYLRKAVRGYTSKRVPRATDDLALTTTGPDGRFRFEDVPIDEDGRRVDVLALADGYALGWRHLPGGIRNDDVRIVLRPESRISGHVRDDSGEPVAGTTVRLKYVMSIRHITQADLEEHRWPRSDDARFVSLGGFRAPPSARTDAEGRFTLSDLPPGLGVFLQAEHPRFLLTNVFAATVEEIDAENASKAKRNVQTGEVYVSLVKGRQLHVQVVYEDSGAPAIGTRYPDVFNGITHPPTFEVDAAGRFEINHLDRRDVHVNVYAPEGSDYLGVYQRVTFPKDVYEKELLIRLPRGAVITGQFVDKETGEGIAGVPLAGPYAIGPLVDGRATLPNISATSDVDGRFKAAVHPGDFTLAVRGHVPGYLTTHGGEGTTGRGGHIQQTVTATLDKPVEGVYLELPRAPVVSGTVYDPKGRPAAGVAITGNVILRIDKRGVTPYRPLNETTDEQGHFLLDALHPAWGPNVAPRPVEVVFRDRERNLGQVVLIDPPADRDNLERTLDVRLQPLGVVTGRFVNADTGQPVSAVRVALRTRSAAPDMLSGHAGSPELRSDRDGRFELVGIFGGAEHHLSITDGRFRRINGLDTLFVGKYGERHDVGDLLLVPLQPPAEERLPQVEAPSVEGLSGEEAYELLAKQYPEDYAAYRQALDEAESDRERDHIVARREPTPAYAEAFRKLADEHRGSDVELNSLVWIVNCRIIGGSEKKVRPLKPPAAERLLEAYIDREELAECVDVLLIYRKSELTPKEHALATAERLLKENPHREVQGRTCYEVARRIALDHYADLSPEERERAKAYLQRVIDEFAEIPHWRHGTLGEAARQDLVELQHLVVGATAPEIIGTDIDGEEMSLSDFRGRVVVLDFWGSWCGPCIGQLPTLSAVAEEFGDRVAVLGVMSDSPEAAQKAVAEHNVQFRNWVDGSRGPIVKQWNIDSWPTTFLIDAQGVIRKTHARDGSLRDAVWELLRKDDAGP